MSQFKVLGGMAVLAVGTTVMNRLIKSSLEHVLSVEEVALLLQTTDAISNLSEAAQVEVREIFGRGYNLQMKIMIGFAVAQLPSTLLMWTKTPIMVTK